MIDLAEIGQAQPAARAALDHELAGGRAADVGPGRRGGQDVPGRDGPRRTTRRIYALHRDTENWHLHLAVNRVHPETEKLVTVNNGFDHEVAHRAIARIEQRQGWQREASALCSGSAGRARSNASRPRDEHERKPSGRARDFEERVGARSAERVAIEEAAPLIRAPELARDARGPRKAGVRFEKKGSGAILWIGDQPVKASSAGRDCSMSALRKRLGRVRACVQATAATTKGRHTSTARPDMRPC